ncbi:MAG: hypothetical protein ACOYT4_03040 [Nanoarchaeota archaeon]
MIIFHIVRDCSKYPFCNSSNSFDIAYAGYLIEELFNEDLSLKLNDKLKKLFGDGLTIKSIKGHDESYDIIKETYRILKKNGLFIFTYHNKIETLNQLSKIGFREFDYLQRIDWNGMPTDTYALKK